MRLVTWNARKGQFARKVPLLDSFCADVAVVQEIARPPAESPQTLWIGDNPNQGVAVVARKPYNAAPPAGIALAFRSTSSRFP